MSVLKHELLERYVAKDSRRKFLAIAASAAGLGAAATAVAQSTGTGTGTTGTTGASSGNDVNVLNYALTLEYLEATFYTQFLGQGTLPTGTTSFTGVVGSVTGNPRAFTTADLMGATGFTGYPAAFGTGLFALLQQIRDHEVAHVVALQGAIRMLGGTPTQPCTYTFPVTSINDFLTTAQALENTGVSAYDGAINMLTSPALIQTGATIATVEARHAGFLNLIAGGGLQSGSFAGTGAGGTGTGGTGSGGTGSTGGTGTGTGVSIPGVSPSPFPSAFDTPLSMAQVIQIASPFLTSCPVPLGSTSVVINATPAASTTAPFSASQVTLDLSKSTSANGQPLTYSFAIPQGLTGVCPATAAMGQCPLTAAILAAPNSSMAIIQFVAGPGYYPLQVTATDSTGKTSTQTILLAYQPSGMNVLPSGTPGITMVTTGSGSTTTGH